MTIIAMDIQPQRSFCYTGQNHSCYVPHANQAVYELNKQAMYAHRRVLVENFHLLGCGYCCLAGTEAKASTCPKTTTPRSRSAIGHLLNTMGNSELLPGLPEESQYDYVMAAANTTLPMADKQLFAWLEQERADTILIGGLPLEQGILEMVLKLAKAGKWRVIVNLAACRGFKPESSIQAILEMRRAGAHVLADINDLPVIRRIAKGRFAHSVSHSA